MPEPTPDQIALEESRAATHAAEATLEISERRYRRLFEAARDGILLLDSDLGRITDANPFMTELLGYSRDEMLGRELWEIGLLQDRDASREAFRLLKKDGQTRYDNLPLEDRRGGRREVEFVSNIYSENGHTVIQCNIRDITERRKAEHEKEIQLAEARERADRDPLTGLWNHRAFHNRLDAEAERAQREGTALAVVMLDLDGFKFFNDVYGHAAGDEVLRLVADRLRAVCRSYDTLSRFGGDEFALLLPGVGHATAGENEARLRVALQGLFYRVGEGEATIPISVCLGTALFPEASTDCHEVLRQADERMRWAKSGGGAEENARLVRTDADSRIQGFSMLDALVTAVDNKDRYTRRHSEDVMEYSLLIARELGIGEAEQRTVAVAALLHDVGKIGVPDAILRKPGRLTDAEFGAVKQHPMMGVIMVQSVPGLEGTLDAVRHHHERWDGEGYPFGLRGEETPLMARLMAVADAFSAMTTDRPYRSSIDRERALSILEAGAGTQWAPDCTGAFLTAMAAAGR
jgi:diguanylate cyclase (GGDEF)-like protein/PAS domain S-box-containing protein